jgi:hypothetical protein
MAAAREVILVPEDLLEGAAVVAPAVSKESIGQAGRATCRLLHPLRGLMGAQAVVLSPITAVVVVVPVLPAAAVAWGEMGF